ncbi:MAG: MATE family efflux transporter [Bacteroidetes bacterium]|nr:MATE family efflux transporter [Bacteroidota bacterium]
MTNNIKITYKNIWKISGPIILALIAQNLLNVIDTIFLGRVGEVSLGAGAIGGLFYLAVVMLGIGFGTGTQILIGRRNGEKNYARIGHILDHSFYFLMVIAIFLFILIKFISPIILKSFLHSEAVFQGATEFIHYRSFGIFFAFINISLNSFYIGTAQTKVLTYSTSLMSAINIVLDYCLIFGNWGFPQMGIGGAALASTIAEFSAAVFLIARTYKYVDLKKYKLFGFIRFDYKLLMRMLKLAFPMMLQNFISFSAWFLFFMIIEKIGEHALAISNIARSIYMVLMIPIWGLSSATNTLVSNLIGQKRPYKVIPLIRKITLMSFLCTITLLQLIFFFPKFLLSFYTNDPILINDSIPTLYVISFALIMFSLTMIMFNGVSGSGNTRVSFSIEVITIASYVVMTYLLAVVFNLGVEKVWLVESFYFIMLGGLSFFYLKYGNWKETKI